MNFINEFTKSNIKIINFDLLQKYITFCSTNDTVTKSKNIKVYHKHHILPKFDKYLSKYIKDKKNIVTLTLDNHIKAHEFLKNATSSSELGYAYITLLRLKNHLSKLSLEEYRIYCTEKVKIWKQWANGLDEDGNRNIDNVIKKSRETKIKNNVYKKWGENQSKILNNIIEYNGKKITTGKMISIKGLNTKINTIIDGKRLIDIIGEKISKTQNKEIILDDGSISTSQKEAAKKSKITKSKVKKNGKTIFQEAGKKLSKKLNEPIIIDEKLTTRGKENMKRCRNFLKKLDKTIIEYDGKRITHRERTNQKIKKTKNKNKPTYIIHGKNAPSGTFLRNEIHKISSSLLRTDKENPLGNTLRSKLTMNRWKKLHQIGWYVQVIPPKVP